MADVAVDLEATIAGIRQALAAVNAPRQEWVPHPQTLSPLLSPALVPGSKSKLDPLPLSVYPSVHAVLPPAVIREEQDQLAKDIERLRSEKLQLERDIARNDQRNSRSSGHWQDEVQGREDEDGQVFARSARPKATRSAAPPADVRSRLPYAEEPSRAGEALPQSVHPFHHLHSFTDPVPQASFLHEKEMSTRTSQTMPEPEREGWDQSEDVGHKLYQMYFTNRQEGENKLHQPASPIDVRPAMPARAQAPSANTAIHNTTAPGYSQQFPDADMVPAHNSTQQTAPLNQEPWAGRPTQHRTQNQPRREIYPSGRMSAPDTELQYTGVQILDQAQQHPHFYHDYGYGYSDYGLPDGGNVPVPDNASTAAKPSSPPKAPTLLQRPDAKKRQSTEPLREAEQEGKEKVKEKKRALRAAAPASPSGPRSHKAPDSPQAQMESSLVAIDPFLPPSLASSHYAPYVPDADAEVIYSDYGGTFSMKDIETPPHTPKGLRNASPRVKPSSKRKSSTITPPTIEDDVLEPTTCELLYNLILQDDYPLINQAGTIFTLADGISGRQNEPVTEPPMGILRTEYTDQVCNPKSS
jgi:hypothetical protein